MASYDFLKNSLANNFGGMSVTTPATLPSRSKKTTKTTLTMSPLRNKTAGSNAQSEQMARTLKKTRTIQKTYGVPGAK